MARDVFVDEPATAVDARRLEEERAISVAYLAAGAAYEIQNPLSRVLARLEVAKASLSRMRPFAEDEEIGRGIEEALEASKRIRKLVDGLSALAVLDRGRVETFDLHECLDLAIDLVLSELGERARLERRYGPLPPVRGHFARLTQAFMDLLLNAAEAIPKGSPAAHRVVVETLADDSGEVLVFVADSGSGIEPADLPHVFEPFFTSKPRPVSTGLGLSTAKGSIVASGGDISIESELGRGTVVRVHLRAVGEAPCAGAPRLEVARRPRNVLVVDADPLVFPAVSRLFENERTILAYASPGDALEALAMDRRIPDLIVVATGDRDDASSARFRDRLELELPHLFPRLVEIALPPGPHTLATRERLESSTRLIDADPAPLVNAAG
jgi:two-component system NtrC family sensor kinase